MYYTQVTLFWVFVSFAVITCIHFLCMIDGRREGMSLKEIAIYTTITAVFVMCAAFVSDMTWPHVITGAIK